MSAIKRKPTQSPTPVKKATEAPAASRKMIGKQTAIFLALPLALLEKVDQAANRFSIKRAGFIKQALTRAVNS